MVKVYYLNGTLNWDLGQLIFKVTGLNGRDVSVFDVLKTTRVHPERVSLLSLLLEI